MAWTTPRTWVTSEVVSATHMNTHVRDNLNALKTPASAEYNTAVNYTTSNTSMTAVDATNLHHSLATAGGPVMVFVTMTVNVTGTDNTAQVKFDLAVDGVEEGLIRAHSRKAGNDLDRTVITLMFMKATLSADTHTFRLKWCIAGTATEATIYDIQMFSREMS
jgi:hypothetical protein